MTMGLSSSRQHRENSIWSMPDRRPSSTSFHRCFQNYYHGHRFLNPNPSYISNVRLSVNHWQLRDLIKIDQATGSIYYTCDEYIRMLSQKRTPEGAMKSRNYLQLPYRPRCFNHAPGGLIVTGGILNTSSRVFSTEVQDLTRDFFGNTPKRASKGLFSIYSPAMGSEMSFTLGEIINNAVTIYPQGNSTSAYTSYVCNNDSHLYMVDISDAGIRGERNIVCEPNTPLNNVHQSSDGRFLTATGDSGSIFIIDPAASSAVVNTIKTDHDSGFGISYHSNELTLATAFQDGTCSLYDLRRTGKPLSEIKSTRPGHQAGAFRSCKFLNSPLQDLLVVSEHMGRVHLIDFRDLSEDNQQVVVFPFALDQFARYRNSGVSQYDEQDTDIHKTVDIFNNEAHHFNAPLVYDYKYLTETNPKLFKDFVYEPVDSLVEENEELVTESHPSDVGRANCDVGQFEDGQRPMAEELAPDPTSYRRQSHTVYQQSVNHVNGEMKLAGVDWYDNKLYVGCEDGGIQVWGVNVNARRSFDSFTYV